MLLTLKSHSRTVFVVATLALLCSLCADTVAQPTAQSPYKLSVFARSTAQFSQPDSLVRWRESIFVGYQNHVAKDGTDGKFSTIVQYSLRGQLQRTFQVQGHNDGLRIIGEDALWALQNEDANPNLVVIDLQTGDQKNYSFTPTPHGGGYDDIVVKGGEIYMTASNPNLNAQNVNVFPALVRVRLSGDMVDVEPVLNGDAAAIDIPTGGQVTLNLTDPDSLTTDPRGNIVLNSQADAELIFIRRVDSQNPVVGRLALTTSAGSTTVDDTAFPAHANDFLLVSDVSGDAVYRIDAPLFGFEPGVPYCSSDTAGIVAVLNLDNGVLAPIATGFMSTRGMVFVSK